MKMYIIFSILIVMLVLAVCNITFLKTLILIARVTPPYEQKVVGDQSLLILGDSTGYGTGASDKSKSIAGLIGADYPNLTITNRSVNGRTIGELRKDIEKLEGTHDVILLQIGANDILQKRSLEVTISDLRQVIDKLSLHCKHIVMISSGNVGGAVRFKGIVASAYQEQSILFKDAFAALAADKSNFTYVDLYVSPENDPFVKEPEIYTAFDGLHPSNEGYILWYKSLGPVLDNHLSIQ